MSARNFGDDDFMEWWRHDLRTPLHIILGYVDNMEAGVRGNVPPEQRADLARIRYASNYLLTMLDDILECVAARRRVLRLTLSEVPLSDVAPHLDLLEPQMSAKGITFENGLHAAEPCPPVAWTDRELLKRVLTNLLVNAIKFTPSGGCITVSCAANAGERTVEVRVSDTGIGIPAHELENVFKPGVRLVGGSAGPERGGGLGLTIGRELARVMGGELKAESTLGAGSTFTLTLPLA